MRRRALLQGGLGAAASLLAACAKKAPGGTPVTPTTGPIKPSDGSLPETFLLTGGGKGLQLFFHGLCAFAQPRTGPGPLHVAMLNGYPDTPEHRHVASLILPRDGVDLSKSTAKPSAIDSNHLVYSLSDVFITLKYEGTVASPGLKVKKTAITKGCVDFLDPTKWDDFGWVLDMTQFTDFAAGTRRDWAKVPDVSQAQFEAQHGSLEQDFDGKEQGSRRDLIEWKINTSDRVVKQAARFRVKEPNLSFELKRRSSGDTTTIVPRIQPRCGQWSNRQSPRAATGGRTPRQPARRRAGLLPDARSIAAWHRKRQHARRSYLVDQPGPLYGAPEHRVLMLPTVGSVRHR